jgi:hypothetical protein
MEEQEGGEEQQQPRTTCVSRRRIENSLRPLRGRNIASMNRKAKK